MGAVVEIVGVILGVVAGRAADAPSGEIAADSGVSASWNSEGPVWGAAGFVGAVFGGAVLGAAIRGAAVVGCAVPGAAPLGAAVRVVAIPGVVAGAAGHGPTVFGDSALRSSTDSNR